MQRLLLLESYQQVPARYWLRALGQTPATTAPIPRHTAALGGCHTKTLLELWQASLAPLALWIKKE